MDSESVLKSIFFDMKSDKNPHKYALLYSSKVYRVINNALRRQTDWNPGTNICKFFRRFVRYFYDHGIYAKDIKSSKLYRGYSKDFKIASTIVDSAFISTSLDKDVAIKFAGSGIVITLKVSKLPQDVPFILIDNSIDMYLDESEIVMLPGTLSFPTPGKYEALYTPVSNVKDICNQKGGGPDMHLTIPHIELRKKVIVWWRAIDGRKVEVLSWHPLPKTQNKIAEDFKNIVFPRDESLQNVCNFIPEYIDFVERRMSYTVFMAVYDMKKAKVDTIHWGVPDDLLPEMFDIKRIKEVEKTIKAEMGGF